MRIFAHHTHTYSHVPTHAAPTLKEVIVAAHLSGLHHDGSSIMESHVGFLLNPCPACSCISLRVMVTCSSASARPTRGIMFTVVCMSKYITHRPAGMNKQTRKKWIYSLMCEAAGGNTNINYRMKNYTYCFSTFHCNKDGNVGENKIITIIIIIFKNVEYYCFR